MWARLTKGLVSLKPRTSLVKRRPTQKRFCSQSTSPQANHQPVTKRSKYFVPITALASTIVLVGGAVAYYKWKNGRDVIPYNPGLAKTCLLTLKQGSSATAIYWASNILSHMAASSDIKVAEALIEHGILEATYLALNAQFEPTIERHIQGRSVYHFLCILESLCAFPGIANDILSNRHGPLAPLIIRTGYEIDPEGDSWIDRLGSIFAALIQASSRLSEDRMPTFLESPEACYILSNRLLPRCSLNTRLLETSSVALEQLCSFDLDSPLELEAKYRYFETFDRRSPNNKQSTHPQALTPTEFNEQFLARVLDVALALSKRSSQLKNQDLNTHRISTSLSQLGALLAHQDSKLLSRLESRFAALQADRSFEDDEEPPPLLFKLDFTPWPEQDSNQTLLTSTKDKETNELLARRNALKSKYLDAIDAMTSLFLTSLDGIQSALTSNKASTSQSGSSRANPSTAVPSQSASNLLKSLVAITSNKDADVMFSLSKKASLMDALLSSFLLVETHTPSTTTSPIEYEEWEACPMPNRSAPVIGSREAAISIRKDSLQLLSNLSALPSVANSVSITRCLCSVQLQLSEQQVLQPAASLLEEAQQTIDLMAPISQILVNVAKYAPEHIKTTDIERLVAMNPSELRSLQELATITTANPVMSSRLLQSHVLYHFVMAPLSTIAGKIKQKKPVEDRENGKSRSSSSKTPVAHQSIVVDDEIEYAKLRLGMQIIANFAEASPEETQSKILRAKTLPLLLDFLASHDAALKGLSILTLARIASSPTERSSTMSSLVPGSLTNGISILSPSDAPIPPQNAPTDPTEVLSTADFDIVFIHGINGHSITTWRVEPNQFKSKQGSSPAVPDPIVLVPASPVESSTSAARSMSPLSSGSTTEGSKLKEEFPICWPRDWLPSYVPNARILTVAYDIALTKWSSNETAPLKQQAANVLQKLRLLGVGEKPTIWICHSFGGLIAKEMLHMSHNHDEFEALLKNTHAIIFFSTPHVGSMLAGYANGPGDLVFRGSPAVIELFPTNWYLHHLNAIFPKIAPQVHTLSIGEIETCFLDSYSALGIDKYACYHIVPDESANPEWPGDQHQFIKLRYNHRQVCKPEKQSDERFQLVVEFLRRHAAQL